MKSERTSRHVITDAIINFTAKQGTYQHTPEEEQALQTQAIKALETSTADSPYHPGEIENAQLATTIEMYRGMFPETEGLSDEEIIALLNDLN